MQDLAFLYSLASVVTSLSYSETFGLTIAESLSCGTPVIVYDNTAQPYIINEETGIAVKSGNIEGVDCEIKQILSGDFKQEMCRSRAETKFDISLNFNKYVKLYDSL